MDDFLVVIPKSFKFKNIKANRQNISNEINIVINPTILEPAPNTIYPYSINPPHLADHVKDNRIRNRASASGLVELDIKFKGIKSDYLNLSNGDLVNFTFMPDGAGETLSIYPGGFFSQAFSQSVDIKNYSTFTNGTGFLSTIFGQPSLRNNKAFIKPNGSNFTVIGTHSIFNKNKNVNPNGILGTAFGLTKIINRNIFVKPAGIFATAFTNPKIYNLRQYVSLNGRGLSSEVFGTPLMLGGVRFIKQIGSVFTAFGTTKVINPTETQYLKPTGIASLKFGLVSVSPQTVVARGIFGTTWGSPYVQRNPSPAGFISERFGTAWVSRSPRYYEVSIGDTSTFGLPRVFDPLRRIYITTVIAGGVFGDVRIRNLNFFVKPQGFLTDPPSNWGMVENTKRAYALKGFNAAEFGSVNIRNATPSFAPKPIESLVFGQHLVAERIRRINTPGIYHHVFGKPTVTKTPEIKVGGFDALSIDMPVVTNYVRYVVATGFVTRNQIGEAFVAMAQRKFKPNGFNASSYGNPTLTHGNRELLINGFDALSLGRQHQVWFRVRSIAVQGIYQEQKAYGHIVGGTQFVKVFGFDATRFGTRIVPENRQLLVNSFKTAEFGTPKLSLTRQFIIGKGFITVGEQPADRWGMARVYNAHQYIVQYFDIDSELNPPKWSSWQSIANRNKIIGATGSEMTRFGRAQIDNKAHPFKPTGIHVEAFGRLFISQLNRPIRLQGIEPPYIPSWSAVYNAAKVIKPKPFLAPLFGSPDVYTNRRYFPRIGNFESMVFGTPMISYRIRKVGFESRYSIGPIYIPIHKVELYTRYVEPKGTAFDTFGMAILSIRKNIITTRWAHRDYFGDATLKNKTPQLLMRGANSEEFGNSSIRLQWRELLFIGSENTVFGKANIAFRDRTVQLTSGIRHIDISTKHVVKGSATPPLMPQYIFLNNTDNEVLPGQEPSTEIKDGYGIAPPVVQVSWPSLRQNILAPEGFYASKFGTTDIYSNGILLENGIKLEYECGTPTVILKNRSISVSGISNPITVGKPQMSPLTVWAVVEAPQQAKDIHQPINLHYVNSDSGYRKPGEVFGLARVWQHRPYLNPVGIEPLNRFGTTKVELKRRYIQPISFQAYRMGWHSVGDGTQEVKLYAAPNLNVFGLAQVKLREQLNKQIKPSGFNALSFGIHWISNLHREIRPIGLNSLAMGNSRGGSLYMPQSLDVGPRRPTIPVGNLMEKFGTTYIGLKVRGIEVIGFDAMRSEYDVLNFDKRMRVTRKDLPRPTMPVNTLGFDAALYGVPNIKPAAHYIRPDGNSDQFRKGAW